MFNVADLIAVDVERRRLVCEILQNLQRIEKDGEEWIRGTDIDVVIEELLAGANNC